MNHTDRPALTRLKKLLPAFLFCAGCLLLNVCGALLSRHFSFPLYLDSVGTILAAAVGGMTPGIVVGYLTNFLVGLISDSALYYGVLNVLIAVCAAEFSSLGWFRKLRGLLLSIFSFALIGGGLGSVITWLISEFEFGDQSTMPLAVWFQEQFGVSNLFAQISSGVLVDLLDKSICVLLAAALQRLLRKWTERMDFGLWYQRPLSPEEREKVRTSVPKAASLRTKIIVVISAAMMIVAFVTCSIAYSQFHDAMIENETKLGLGLANVIVDTVNGDRVADYLAQGEAAEGYAETETALYALWNSTNDIEYIYVYQILEDGCHVVFDLDTPDTPGGEPGDLVPFDESFSELLPALLAGERIDPLITNDTYGWLFTFYEPIYDSTGACVCYAGVDISMERLQAVELSFVAKEICLFIGFFALILAVSLWLAEYGIILPVNTIAHGAKSFAFNSGSARRTSMMNFYTLDIQTGDEIENLYVSFTKTTDEMFEYLTDVQLKNRKIQEMQRNLITLLADMVESRDKFTGDHVRKTAAYVEIIMNELKREGLYPDILTKDYISEVVSFAPLHDVGKIHVSDVILNKPGKLTDEEFREMQSHTTLGKEIIGSAIGAVADASFLEEAKNLAAYHHERWDGKGYSTGLAGEAIPLSARIMAVADVFDALVSKRSYKNGFPIEKALDIIREGAGSHFDPTVVQAFLKAEPEVRRVAAEAERRSAALY